AWTWLICCLAPSGTSSSASCCCHQAVPVPLRCRHRAILVRKHRWEQTVLCVTSFIYNNRRIRWGQISVRGSLPVSSAREQHDEENVRRFGSSWPLLRCAMASKGLLDHVIPFS
ncbi:unnamed protein product, partial [Closterium sp. NIES-65]